VIEEVIETRGFARKNKNGREADRRLANQRLQPLGHLTAARKLNINEIATYAPATDWRSPLYSHEPASTSLATRVLKMRGAVGTGVRTGLGEAPVPKPMNAREA
jgi:hypothetical protein